MIPILSREAAGAIEEAARGPALLAFDFDGTLAPIVDDPRLARMTPATATLLSMAEILFPVAVISGRDRADVIARLGHAHVAVIGNHGGEPEGVRRDSRTVRRVTAWASTLSNAFASEKGIEVEKKALSVSVHYRLAADRSSAHRRVLEASIALPGTRVFEGHSVVNIAPEESHTKGQALESLASRLHVPGVVFVGDDVTDEDAFLSSAVTLGIRVGASVASAATHFLETQGDVDELLRAFIATRSRLVGPRARWQVLRDDQKTGGNE